MSSLQNDKDMTSGLMFIYESPLRNILKECLKLELTQLKLNYCLGSLQERNFEKALATLTICCQPFTLLGSLPPRMAGSVQLTSSFRYLAL